MPDMKEVEISMTPREVFMATLPFVKLKLTLKMIYVVMKVAAITLAIWGFMYHGAWAVADGGELFVFQDLNFLILPAVILFAVIPLVSLLLRNYGRYMVRVGHIAVIVRIITTGKVPANQVTVGLNAVKQNFMRANVFFLLDRIVHRTVVELQATMRGVLMGFGFLAALATMFKGNLIRYIDECCLAYTFMRKDVGVFQGAVLGIVTYVHGWRSMAKQAVIVTLEYAGITFLFYLIGGGLLWLAIGTQSVIAIALSLLFIFIVGAIKSCVLDSYLMVMMLTSFIKEARKQGNIEESIPMIEKVAAMSGSFSNLVFQANQNEPFLSQEDEMRIISMGRRGFAPLGTR